MIEITQSVDVDTQTVSWTFKDLGPEHEFEGKSCHVVSESASRAGVGRCLELLGYQYVVTIERPTPSFSTAPHNRVEYWTRLSEDTP